MPHTGSTPELNLPYMNDGDEASGDDFGNQAVGIENQLITLADAWGPGVLGADSWEVTEAATALTVSIALGAGLVDRFAGATTAATELAVVDDTSQFVWAIPTVSGSDTTQAWIMEPTFALKPAGTGYTGTVLAEVVADGGVLTITDLRVQIGQGYLEALIDANTDDIAWIADALGVAYLDYDPEGALATVDARLDAVEAGLAGTSITEVFWGLLKLSASDTRTVSEWHADYHAAVDEARAGLAVIDDNDAICASLLGELIREVGLHGNDAIRNQRGVYVFHAHTSPDSMYDKANSTAHPDRLAEVIR